MTFRLNPKVVFSAVALTLTSLFIFIPSSDAYVCDGYTVSSQASNNTGDCTKCANDSGDQCINQSGHPKCDPD